MTIDIPEALSQHERGGSQDWSAGQCLRTLYRHKWTLASITGACILAAGVVSVLQPRVYRGEAALEVQGINDNFLNLRDINPTTPGIVDGSGIQVQTQVEKLQQDGLLELVAARLSSAGHDIPGGVDTLRKNLEVVPARGSRIIRILYDARDPKLASDVANTVAKTFLDETLRTRQSAAQEILNALRRQIQDLTGKPRWSEVDRQFYNAMSQKVAEAGMAAAMQQPDMRLVSAARPARRPHLPNIPLNLAIAMFGGLVLGIGYVMLNEQSNSRLRAPGEAGSYLTLPELGVIPTSAKRGRKSESEHGPLSEPYRATLASILSSCAAGQHPRTLLVTSSRSMEGKTTVVSNLGLALAEISGKVLLIDGDMRRPKLHKVFGQANSWGLSDVLQEKNAIEELPLDVLVKKTSIPHLYLLPSGASTDNVFSLLYSGRMAGLLPRFRQEFDYVLVDAPPCLEYADARIMARYTDKSLLVVRSNYTDRRTAQAAVQRLQLDGIPVMGVVLNHWNPAGNGIYGYGYDYPDRQDAA